MSGLTERAGGGQPRGKDKIAQAHEAWQESMERRIDEVRGELRQRQLHVIATCTGGEIEKDALQFRYWGRLVLMSWPALEAHYLPEGENVPVFDLAMLLYYLDNADGVALADRWIGYRELPDGAFYHQAFQGYSGDLVSRHFGDDLESFIAAARHLGGSQLPALAPAAFTFMPLPRIRLALALWPGDEDFLALRLGFIRRPRSPLHDDRRTGSAGFWTRAACDFALEVWINKILIVEN